MVTHVHHEVFRPFQGSLHFVRDQRLRLETPGWRVLDFRGDPLIEDKLERLRAKIKKGPLVVRDREHPIAVDLITDGLVLLTRSCQFSQNCLVSAVCAKHRASQH